jgi:CRISPR system Cascade subunit CasB
MSDEKKEKSRPEAFVGMVIERLNGSKPDTAFSAALRKADNPATEYYCWEYLIKWCDIENSKERKAFIVVGAAIAKTKPRNNGSLGIGQAIVRCYSSEGTYDGNENNSARSKLRRLLICTTTEEACDILRPLLSLIRSREVPLDYAGLLKDLLYSDKWFNEGIKPQWAKDFFYKKEAEK